MAGTNENLTLSEGLLAATEALAEQLLLVEPFVAFHAARTRLEDDAAATDLLDCMAAAQVEVRQRQQHNLVTQADIERLRTLQREIQENSIIMAFAEAQRVAQDYLADVNQEIGQVLDVDFAAFAGLGCGG